MRKGYLALLVILVILLILYLLLPCWLGLNRWFDYCVSILGAFAAIFAVVVALAIADKKRNEVKIKRIDEPFIDGKKVYEKKDLDEKTMSCYKSFPVISYRVHFKLKNKSGFDLKNPVLTFTNLPKEMQPPYSRGGKPPYSERHFTFNIVRADKRAYSLEVDEKLLISLDGLPYWNKDSEIDSWIRMVFDAGNLDPFDVGVSVNCEDADGTTLKVRIEPKELLKNNDLRRS